jgi:PucR C-terminal helix-turn-helix domain
MASVDSRFVKWSERFEKSPLAKDVVTRLKGRASEIWRGTFELLRKESPEYRNAVDDEFTAESKSHCGELLETIAGIASGRSFGGDPFEFVRRHAEWRARHQVPLVASLHAYRLAHKTYWGITRQPLSEHRRKKEALHALSMLSDFWIEFFEAVGATLEEAHAAEEARIFSQNTHAHAQLIDELLSGAEPSGIETNQLLTLCGIRPGMVLTVAVFRRFSVEDGKPVDAEVALRSLVRMLHQVLPSSQFGKLVGLRNSEVVLIIGCGGGPVTQALTKQLARNGFSRKNSVGAGGGVGLDKQAIAQLPEALSEARLALPLTSPAKPLLRFGEIDLLDFVIRRADNAALRLIPAWVREAHETGIEQDLLRTIRAFAQCSLNVKATAKELGVHTNTVYFRLNQIQAKTGVDARAFTGLSHLVTSLHLLDRHPRK